MRPVAWGLLLLCACAGAEDFRPLAVGDAAPRYTAATLAGDTVSVERLGGRAIVVNIWATWCLPCQHEMPGLQRLYGMFADSGLAVLGVSVDGPGAEESVRAFVAQHGIRFPIARDPVQRVARTFRTIGVPETFLIDRRGRVVKRWIGEFDPTGDAAVSLVRQALAGRPPV